MKTYHECKLADGKMTLCTQCVSKLADGAVLFQGSADGAVTCEDIQECKSVAKGQCAACEDN